MLWSFLGSEITFWSTLTFYMLLYSKSKFNWRQVEEGRAQMKMSWKIDARCQGQWTEQYNKSYKIVCNVSAKCKWEKTLLPYPEGKKVLNQLKWVGLINDPFLSLSIYKKAPPHFNRKCGVFHSFSFFFLGFSFSFLFTPMARLDVVLSVMRYKKYSPLIFFSATAGSLEVPHFMLKC